MRGKKTNQIAAAGEMEEFSPWENITRDHDSIKPSHIDPPSPRNILYFLPINPRLKNKKVLRDIDI